jgi:transcriptional regulator with XRE-family HTH domain
MSPYKTLTGRIYDQEFTPEEKPILEDLQAEFAKNPKWEEFSDFWQGKLRTVLGKLSREKRTTAPLYRIAQDLEMRLGIAQGDVAEPDYRDYLADQIEEKFGSRYRFCQETNIPQAFLSQVLSGKKDFSVEMLRRAAEALGLGLALLPKADLALAAADPNMALHRLIALIAQELSDIDTLLDHLKRFEDPELRRKAVWQEPALFKGSVEEVVDRLKSIPERRQGDEVIRLLDQKKNQLDEPLAFLRRMAAKRGDEAGVLAKGGSR